MSYYGNILTVYEATEAVLESVVQVLVAHQTIFVRKETTFFVETTSKTNTKQVIDALTQMGLIFTFFHNHNPDGSVVKTNRLRPDAVQLIQHIMFSDDYPRKRGPYVEIVA